MNQFIFRGVESWGVIVCIRVFVRMWVVKRLVIGGRGVVLGTFIN